MDNEARKMLGDLPTHVSSETHKSTHFYGVVDSIVNYKFEDRKMV
jgi:hypothetical protein